MVSDLGHRESRRVVEKNYLTSIRPIVRTDISQSHDIDFLQPLDKARKS